MRPGFILFVFAVLGALAAGSATAQPGRLPGVLPLDRILPGVRREYPGEFYDADGPTPGPDGGEHYHLKWMTPDGRIMWLDTDARTGRVLGAAPGRDSFDAGPGRYFAPAPSFPVPERGFGRRDFPQGGPPDGREGGPFRGGGRGGYGGGRDGNGGGRDGNGGGRRHDR